MNSARLSFVLAALLAAPCALAASLYWDGGTADILSDGNGASGGGAGAWNTTIKNWDAGAAPHVAWNNTANAGDTAVFAGAAGTVALGTDINLGGLNFTGTSGSYTLSGNTLNFAAGATITNPVNGALSQTITAAITGSPAVACASDGSYSRQTVFAPTSGSQTLGTCTVPYSDGSGDKCDLILGGTTTGNSAAAVTHPSPGGSLRYAALTKEGTGTWSVGNVDIGMVYVKGGNLIATGRINTYYQGVQLSGGTLHHNNAGAVGLGGSGGGYIKFSGGSLDNTSGAAVTATSNTPLQWSGNLTFIGTNGANSNLNLGTGAVTLGGSYTATVQHAATTLTIGGVISDGTSSFGLTKAGAGTLRLTGLNTYNGDTTVSEGTLSITQKYLDDNATVSVATGATLNLDFTGTDTVHHLVLGGSPAALGEWAAIGSGAANQSALLTGTGRLNNLGNAAPAGTWYWDGPNTGGTGDGFVAGGTGTWSTSNANWDKGYVARETWDNVGKANDTAVFGGTVGTVTLGGPISLKEIRFTSLSSNYTIAGNTLNFSAGGTITQSVVNLKHTITSAITGSPAVRVADGTGYEGLTFAPTSGTVTLGTCTIPYENATGDKAGLHLGGTTTGNSVGKVQYDSGNRWGALYKEGTGTWSVGNVDTGIVYLNGGSLVALGTINTWYQALQINSGGVFHYNHAAAVGLGGSGGGYITINSGGALDNSSGAPVTALYNTPHQWAGDFTFLGSNGAASDLHLGAGPVTLYATRQVNVQNAAATLIVGGTIAPNGGTATYGLTKAGPGTLRLTGVNTYSGPTTVSAGTLQVNGALDPTSVVTVAGGRLGGTGTVGTVSVQAAGTLAPGNAMGALNAANVTLRGTLAIQIDDTLIPKCNTLAVSGALDITGATLALTFPIDSSQAAYVIATYDSLAGTFATVNGLPGAWTIDYAYNSGTAIALVPPTPTTPPLPPGGLTASSVNGIVKLTWNPSPGAAGYQLKRALVSGGPYALITSTQAKSYDDTQVTIGVRYYYVVSAVNTVGEGANSTEASALPVLPPPPAVPGGLTATGINGRVKLTWTAASGATSYQIRRASVSGGPYTLLATTAATSYEDTQVTIGVSYYYVVAAANPGGESANTGEAGATAPADPLLTACAALKNHITGTATLTAAQIQATGVTINEQSNRFAESTATVTAVLDLVATYDTVKGALWVATGSLTRSTDTGDLIWTICHTMQSIMDQIYGRPGAVTTYQSQLNGFKFGSSTNFPGACAPPADPNAITRTVAINAGYPRNWGHAELQGDTARKPTGTYLAPGSIATVTVPQSMVGRGYKIRVGAHAWDMSNRPTLKRLDRSTLLYEIAATATKVASPLGGGIYIEVPYLASAGVVSVTITGAVRSPYFSAKSFHRTTLAEWQNTERHYQAPWADFQSEKFMFQVPRTFIYNYADPVTAMQYWDDSMDVMNDLMGFPHDRGKETLYVQPDLQLRASVYAPGYPAINRSCSPSVDAGGDVNWDLLHPYPNGPWETELHERGHAYSFTKFPGESESEVNLLYVPIAQLVFGKSLDAAFRESVGSGNTYQTLDTTAIAWMCTFNFSPKEQPMAELEKQYQLKGHAKFVDIARLYGWSGLNAFWASFNQDVENGVTSATDLDSLLLRLSKSVGKDIRPLFHFWGVFPQNPATLGNAIAAAGLKPPAGIYDLLLHYKSLVPADNAAFRTFALAWWGRKPLITGYWEETDHAMQWDEIEDGDAVPYVGVRPNGDIYVEASAASIQGRVQELVDLYYPNGRPDDVPPTLAASAIVDNKSGGPVTVSTPVTYTVTFSEDMDAGTVTAADFGNAGGAVVSIGSVAETSPGVFTVQVTPTSAGTLQLQINAGAVLKDVAGNALNTASAIADDTTIAINAPGAYAAWQAANGASGQTLADDHDGDGVPNGIEWFLKGSNNSTGFTALPGIVKDPGTGALCVSWTKDAGYTGTYGTDFVVETSDSLTGTWTPEASPGTVTLNGNEVKYTFRSPPGTKRFARLKVTGP